MKDWNAVLVSLMPQLKPGVILALSGPLGAGKTTFTQLLAQALGIAGTPKSPTFGLLRVHELPFVFQGVKRLMHVDAYRIEQEGDLMALNLEEELGTGDTMCVLEWPEKVETWLKNYKNKVIWMGITLREDGTREVTVE